jgi:hypothetical protein
MSQPDHHLKPNPHISAMIVASIANHSGVDNMDEQELLLQSYVMQVMNRSPKK